MDWYVLIKNGKYYGEASKMSDKDIEILKQCFIKNGIELKIKKIDYKTAIKIRYANNGSDNKYDIKFSTIKSNVY